MKSRQALGTALVVCTADRPAETRRRVLDQFGDDELAQLAQHAAWHRVVPFLAAAVRTSGVVVSEEAMASLERTHATRTAAHLRVLADLDAVVASLSDGAVPFLVVKGPVLSEHLYPSPDLRTYEDLDLLIPPGSFERAVDALRASGSVLLDRNWALTRADTRGQLHFQLPMGTLADVHWHLLNRENVRDGFSITTDDLFERSREVDVGGRSVPTLDPVDTLLHVALARRPVRRGSTDLAQGHRAGARRRPARVGRRDPTCPNVEGGSDHRDHAQPCPPIPRGAGSRGRPRRTLRVPSLARPQRQDRSSISDRTVRGPREPRGLLGAAHSRLRGRDLPGGAQSRVATIASDGPRRILTGGDLHLLRDGGGPANVPPAGRERGHAIGRTEKDAQ